MENIKTMKVLLNLLNIYLFFQKRDDLSINCEEIESLSFEITNNKTKNVIYMLSIGHVTVV